LVYQYKALTQFPAFPTASQDVLALSRDQVCAAVVGTVPVNQEVTTNLYLVLGSVALDANVGDESP
jgi:hypothetical protein